MPNDTCLTSEETSSPSTMSGPPPPYTDDYPQHPTRLPNNLNLSRLAEQTIQQINEVIIAA
jgi:hypothetical protein